MYMNIQFGVMGLLIAGLFNIISFVRSLMLDEVLMGVALFLSFIILVISFLNIEDKCNI